MLYFICMKKYDIPGILKGMLIITLIGFALHMGVVTLFNYLYETNKPPEINIDKTCEIRECDTKETHDIYLLKGELYPLKEGDYTSEDEKIIKIINSKASAHGLGETTVFDGCDTYIFHVSDLYTKEMVNEEKEFLPEKRYTNEENEYLDKALAFKISEAGEGTRAGVVAAARFLTLQFPYKLDYFEENGRLAKSGHRANIDGEGRWYHKGLYLSESKYSLVENKMGGPKHWGEKLKAYSSGKTSPNGLDCSGFVTWAIYNGGFDIGDIGSGDTGKNVDELDDKGEKVKIAKGMDFDFKPGDLAYLDGHIGMVIGLDESNVYVAESYWDVGLHVLTYTRDEFVKCKWKYIIKMDELYKEDGNLTYMW